MNRIKYILHKSKSKQKFNCINHYKCILKRKLVLFLTWYTIFWKFSVQVQTEMAPSIPPIDYTSTTRKDFTKGIYFVFILFLIPKLFLFSLNFENFQAKTYLSLQKLVFFLLQRVIFKFYWILLNNHFFYWKS